MKRLGVLAILLILCMICIPSVSADSCNKYHMVDSVFDEEELEGIYKGIVLIDIIGYIIDPVPLDNPVLPHIVKCRG